MLGVQPLEPPRLLEEISNYLLIQHNSCCRTLFVVEQSWTNNVFSRKRLVPMIDKQE